MADARRSLQVVLATGQVAGIWLQMGSLIRTARRLAQLQLFQDYAACCKG